ncbi:MAG: hypothetical protein AAF223_21090, partial [Bacteroidota bacterium]
MHAKPTLRLKLVKLTLGLMLVLLALTGCFIVAVSQSLPSRTERRVQTGKQRRMDKGHQQLGTRSKPGQHRVHPEGHHPRLP